MKRKYMQQNFGRVIVPANLHTSPEPHELEVARILADHFFCDVEFLIPIDDYLRKTADILMLGVEWEIKCPNGASKSTVRNQFRRASRQSKSIIIDTRRTKLAYENIYKAVLLEVKERPYIKNVILIDKFKNIIELRL